MLLFYLFIYLCNFAVLQYVVVDYLWYRRKVPGANATAHGFDVIDEWGRVIPDPVRWPSSKGGVGFTEVANKVHSMGLKFGIHVMRGISWQAYDANTPILDTKTGGRFTAGGKEWHAQDIGIKERSCGWMQQGFMSVNANLEAGRAFLRSLYEQYAQWGVDFIKNDCVFGDDLDKDQITFVSEVLQSLQRPILYSLSPGTSATPAMAKDVARLTNMYRVTGDDWDTWGDVAAHFDVARDFAAANMIGAQGLRGKSWPDLDMLPLGWLTDPASNEGPHRPSKLTLDEQKTQMWELNNDGALVSNYSGLCAVVNRAEANFVPNGLRAWRATGRNGETYIAFFNLNSAQTTISANVADMVKTLPVSSGMHLSTSCKYREVWSGREGFSNETIPSMTVPVHGCALFVMNCA
ncbi:hypothetical protein Tsubulata_048093 [Turnera subulata]|uniref:alpha-galactosidase n=1 Tax=Turnera subulata TaxID=218843 RepID=A0A9Q0FW60_9ROSI|nr:hypothetical protein Tsubulata_048093 [Turnera subulata]